MENKKMKSIRALFVSLLITFASFSFVDAQTVNVETDLPDEFGPSLGAYKIKSFVQKPREFQNFDRLFFDHLRNEDMDNPKTDNKNRVRVKGGFILTDGTDFKFKDGYPTKTNGGYYQKLEFRSVELNGISYAFGGNFLEEKLYEYGSYTLIKGVLTKYTNGIKIASREFPFHKYTEH